MDGAASDDVPMRSLPARASESRRELGRRTSHELAEVQGERHARLPAARPSASVLEIVWAARWSVAVIVVIFLGVAIAYLRLATPIYSSSARVVIEREAPTILNSDTEQSFSSSKNYLHTQCSVLKSTPIASAAISTLDIGSMQSLQGVSDPVAYLKSRLIAELGLKDDIITCSLESPYPEEASALVNAVVAAYVRYQSAHRRSTTSDVLKVLQAEKSQRATELKQKTEAMLAFRQANGMLSFSDEKGNIITQRLGRLSDEVTNAQLQTVLAVADHEAARAALEGDPARRSEWIQALFAKGELRDMDATYQRLSDTAVALEVQLATTPNAQKHPRAEGARQMLTQVKEKLAEQEGRIAQAYLAMTARKMEMAQGTEAAILARYKEQEQVARELNSRMAEFGALEAAVKQAERYSELLDGRINELMTLEQVPAMNIRVLEPAQASNSPVRPVPLRVLGIAVVLALFCGSGIALARARMEQRMVSLPEIASLLNVPVLGAIPYISRGLREEGTTSRSGVQRNPLSEVAEAHRMIRASICYGLPPNKSRTILITSAAAKEGKSTVSSGLAWAMCEAGERVLLIDADLRRPVQHSIFNLDGNRGVTDVVAGRLTLAEAIAPSGIHGLDILPCGSAASVPTGIINSEAFADMLMELTHRYDRIVLDSPPAGLVADARVLAALTDVTLLVVRAGRTTRKDALRAAHGLVNVGARLRGVIVNVAKNPFSEIYPGGGIYYRQERDTVASAPRDGNGQNGNGSNDSVDGKRIGDGIHPSRSARGTTVVG